MQFRCPNCRQPVKVVDEPRLDDEKTLDAFTCPSCHGLFTLSNDATASITLQSGYRVEQFELQHVLGEGGFGVVYKAWDKELERHVALKLPRPGVLSAEGAAPFLREARMAASIEDKHVVKVYEIGKYGETIYIASQLIEGVNLREQMRLRKYSEREIAELLVIILRTIQKFHEKGVIHRDLKPSNILIATDGTPYISDFGLAKRETNPENTVTQTGNVVGTALYMAPEQADGKSKSVSGRSDIFSVGVILFELLTGKRPFEATDSRTVLYRLQTEESVLPKSIRSTVSRDLNTICWKALRKNPAERFQSAGAMADQLELFLQGKPLQIHPPGVFERSWKFVRRHPRAVAVGVASVVLVALLFILFTRTPPGMVAVVIETETGPSNLRFVRYNGVLRVPHESGFTVEADSGEIAWVLPGLYRISATDD